jgi:hypothetical protein
VEVYFSTMPRVVRIQDFALPEGALCFDANGWAYGDLHSVGIALKGITLANALDGIMKLHGSLLGPGELVFATPDEKGYPDGRGSTVVDGFLVFVPAD